MARNVQPQFDSTAEFYVTRPLLAGGRSFAVGELFDKSLVPVRRLRQMFELRQLRLESAQLTVEQNKLREEAVAPRRFRPAEA